jgi:ribosome-associated protein
MHTDSEHVRDDQLVVTRSLAIPLGEFSFTFVRSSGPGGQNVNKVATKACLRWPVMTSPSLTGAVRDRFLAKYGRRISNDGDFLLNSQRYRDRQRNIDDCFEKLQALLLSIAVAPRKRRKTRPTRASKERRLDSNRKQAGKKQMRRRVSGDD